MRIVAVLAAATVGGCLSTPGPAAIDAAVVDAPIDALEIDAPTGCLDEDGDGWPVGGAQCGRYLDCHDDDDQRYPGIREDGAGVLDLDCVEGTIAGGQNVPDLLSASMGTGRRITTRNSVLIFHPNASHQLWSLELGRPISSGELLFTGAMNEKWTGTNVWEGFFSWQSTGTPSLDLDGPAVVQWRVPFNTTGLVGFSLYTIYLDGRIQRSDEFTVIEQPAMPALKSVTSYLALDAAQFEGVTWSGAAGAVTDIDQTSPFLTYFTGALSNATSWLCARTASFDVVWAHGAGTVGPATPSGARITSSSGGWGQQIALQYDWTFAADQVVLGMHHGNFLIMPTYRNPTNPCGTAGQIASAYYRGAFLVLNGANGVSVLEDGGDADGDGFVEVGGYYLINAEGGPGLSFTIDTASGRTPPPVSTFRIRNLPIDPLPVVTRTPASGPTVVMVHGRDYRIQADGTGMWLVITILLVHGDRVDIVRAYQP